MSESDALLVLADGTVFRGRSFGADGESVGELVFNTAMTGYQEILTDPSYTRQIVTLTSPQIGNTGINPDDAESDRIYAAGLVVRSATRQSSQWRSVESLPDYLQRHQILGIEEIDTRMLTRILREHGAIGACLRAGTSAADVAGALVAAQAFGGLHGIDLARVVSTAAPYVWHEGSFDLDQGTTATGANRWQVVAYDFGLKRNILRLLADRGCRVTVVPATTPASVVLSMRPDGVFLSNGPGDPAACSYAISAIAELLRAQMPLFGICLGHQLLALAAGARTIKMKFGHHGANHPVQDLRSGRVMISSQNHGFAVDEASLPSRVIASHRSLFDGSLQGITLVDAPAYGFQGHPEASPGPHDVAALFDPFLRMMQAPATQPIALLESA